MTTTTTVTPRSTIRRSDDRGRTRFGWLDSRHSFSFGEYFDESNMGFRSLRVINDDYIMGGGGFPTHPHRDMEIISYVVSGELEHRDSMGNGSVIRPGEVQAMSAGTGIAHSEFNPSRSETAHLLQIWIIPDKRGLSPSYSEWKPTAATANQPLTLLASPGGDGGVTIHQDALLYLGRLEAGAEIAHTTSTTRGLWLHVVEGEVETQGATLTEGDAIAIEGIDALTVRATRESRFLLFDLA